MITLLFEGDHPSIRLDMPESDRRHAVVEFTRGGIVESRHRAFVCVVDSAGSVVYSRGDPDFVTFMRSSAKPLQALAVLTTGAADAFGFSDRDMAVISGSHGGEPVHIEQVASILSRIGLTAADLQCGVHPPLDEAARRNLAARHEKPSQLHHNCSGKHSGMLATARHMGEPLQDYLSPSGPTQERITRLIASAASVDPAEIVIGIDGCSAPVHGLSMRAAALAFARIIDPVAVSPEIAEALLRVGRSMRAHPAMVAAHKGRICTELMRAGREHELCAKAGAEGFYAVAWRDRQSRKGMGMTVKIEDGAQRARNPLVIALLQQFDILPSVLGNDLLDFAERPLVNYARRTVGSISVKFGSES